MLRRNYKTPASEKSPFCRPLDFVYFLNRFFSSLEFCSSLLKLALVLLLLPSSIFSSEFKKHLEKDKESLKYLETYEDNKRLGLFSALFDMAGKRERASGEIPKV